MTECAPPPNPPTPPPPPEEEEEELTLIYQAKGLSETESKKVAKNLIPQLN